MKIVWSVECWRGIAALLVVWTHWAAALGQHQGLAAFAFTGVDIFFVISGFVFAPQMLGSQPPRLCSYAMRRMLRIYPAYLAALALYVLLAWHSGRPVLYLAEHVLMAHVQSREMAFYYNPPFWSLPAEVQFYALVPLVAWLVRARGPEAWRGLLALSVLVRLALLPMADGTTQNLPYLLLHHLPGLLIEFLLGVWAWQLQAQSWSRGRRVLWVAGGLAGWLACAWLFGLVEAMPERASWFNGQLGLPAAASFACILAAGATWQPTSGWLDAAGQWAGRLSYGIYLLHAAWTGVLVWACARWGTWTGLGMTCAGLLASVLLLHLLVEEPARRWGRAAAERWDSLRRQPSGG